MITKELELYVMSLLALGNYTLKEISRIVGLNQHTIKSIDLKRLKLMYTNVQISDKRREFFAVDSVSFCALKSAVQEQIKLR